MRNLYIALNIAAVILLIPATNFASITILLLAFTFSLGDFWASLFTALFGLLLAIIPVVMLLSSSYWKFGRFQTSILILAATVVVACTTILGYQSSLELSEPLYRLFIPNLIIEWLVPGYHLM